jgi:asparagine synthase (glutamine-hydrolysing)
MCGLTAIAALRGAEAKLDELRLLNDRIAHRGPDGEGVWQSPDRSVALGHRRLAIIDTSERGSQPILSDDGRWAMVFNGEIYNFLELRRELEAKGYRFHSDSDSEVLLNGWREWRWDLLPKMNGMWAFVICDVQSGDLFMSRDRFGVKPLAYAETARGLYIASEVQALLALPDVAKTISSGAVQRAVFDPFCYESSARDLFDGVAKLPAGHYAEYRGGSLRVSRYWHTVDHLITPPRTLAEAGEQFRELFDTSVALRMRSDVRIGTCLSGGFDSSAVACTMAALAGDSAAHEREADDWRHAIVATFPGLSNDETASARIAARAAGIEPTILDFSSDDGTERIDEILGALDGIYISLPTAIWKTYRAVDNLGVKVTLDGHGADEAFGGYRAANARLAFALRVMLGTDVGRGPVQRNVADRIRRQWFAAKGSYFLNRKPLAALDRFDNPFVNDEVPGNWSMTDRRFYGMFHIDILPTLLRNYDRMSMAHGVEVRMPFMDWRLVTFIMSLPEAFKADAQFTKLAARVGMAGRIPDEIRLSPRKVGFSSQMPTWMNGSLGSWAQRQLENPHPAMPGMFDTTALLEQVKANNAAKSWDWSTSDRIWPYVNLDWYLKKHAG